MVYLFFDNKAIGILMDRSRLDILYSTVKLIAENLAFNEIHVCIFF